MRRLRPRGRRFGFRPFQRAGRQDPRRKVIIVTQGGIGKPIDEVALNQALFEKEGVEIIGVILNKVLRRKDGLLADFARRGLKRKGLELLGVIPHQPHSLQPDRGLDPRRIEGANCSTRRPTSNTLVDDVVVGAMGAQNAMSFFKRGVLLITPGDREDIVLAACTSIDAQSDGQMAGHRPDRRLAPQRERAENHPHMPIPVLLAAEGQLPSRLQSSRFDRENPADDAEKISLIRDLVAKNVNVKKILDAI